MRKQLMGRNLTAAPSSYVTRHQPNSCQLQVKQPALKNKAITKDNNDNNDNNSIYKDDNATTSHDSLWQELAEIIDKKGFNQTIKNQKQNKLIDQSK